MEKDLSQTVQLPDAGLESLFRHTLDSSTDAFFILDAEWRFVYINESARRMMAHALNDAEVVGRSVWDLSPQLVGSEMEHEYQRAMREQVAVHFNTHSSETERWYEVHAYPSLNALAVYFRDFTDRRRAETELRESEARFRQLAENIREVFYIMSPQGDITYVSPAFEEVWGRQIQPGELLDTLVPEDREALAALQPKRARGERTEIQFRIKRPNGEIRWIYSRSFPVCGDNNDLLRTVGIAEDITEAKQREQDLETRRVELESSNESRMRFMRGFSHDLKNPIGAADGHAALLEDSMLGELNEAQLKSVGRIRASLGNAVSLINDLVELARAEAGQLVLKPGPVDVREIARELVENYRPAAEQAGLTIDCSLDAVDITQTDSDRVRQILGNLLTNAVKYTRAGGSVEVRTGMREAPAEAGGAQCVAIDVVDTGIGIPQDKLGVLFTEFERIDPKVKPGAGLGLAISRRIARLLGGEVTVETERGTGSTFTLWLPGGEAS